MWMSLSRKFLAAQRPCYNQCEANIPVIGKEGCMYFDPSKDLLVHNVLDGDAGVKARSSERPTFNPISISDGFRLTTSGRRMLSALCKVDLQLKHLLSDHFGDSRSWKYTQVHQLMMVRAVRGIEIAARSQALADICIVPPFVVFTN